MNITIKWK